MKTYMQKTAQVKHAWHVVDAKDQVLGQVATAVAIKLMGKHKTTYTPNIDDGDFVVVLNSSQVRVTKTKGQKKMYYNHSSFPGGIHGASFDELQAKDPTKALERAVYNMLPTNRLRKERMGRLKIYAGTEHPHASQLGK